MGGIIEDYIFKALMGEKLPALEIMARLNKKGIKRTTGNLNYHLKKMYEVKKLQREKNSDGLYLYWNDLMLGKKGNWKDNIF